MSQNFRMLFNCKIGMRRTRLHIDTTYSDSEHNSVLELLFNELSETSHDNVYFFSIFKVYSILSTKLPLHLKLIFIEFILSKKLPIDKYYTF